jgi:CheY-like chemotaxis protein
MSRRIVLINYDPAEIELIQQIINRLSPESSLLTVRSGREALDVLMGSQGMQVKPDLVLASALLPDMSAFELFSIIRKYHSLSNLKFYLLSDRAESMDSSQDPLFVDGYVHRPLSNDKETANKFATLLFPHDKLRLASVGLFAIPSGFVNAVAVIKQKLVGLSAVPATKLAVCASCAIAPCVVAVQSFGPDLNGTSSMMVMEAEPMASSVPVAQITVQFTADSMPAEPMDMVSEPHETVTKELPEPVAEPKIDTATAQLPVPAKDTAAYRKTFSIGVKKIKP